MYCVDLETSFAGKGSKRKDAWILQIGAASSTKMFDMLVRPEFRLAVTKPSDLYRELRLAKQQPRMTINFWTRVIERTNNVKRTGTREEFIIRHIPKMVPLHTALHRLIAFTGVSATVWAHNGKSFDFPILRGNAEKVDVSFAGWSMQDSLPVVRKAWPSDRSHSLPNVYKNHVSKTPYRAHLAGDDAVALYKVLEKALPVYQANAGKKLVRKGLTTGLKPGMVPGLGKVACQRLKRKNIRTLEDLKKCLKKDNTWWKSTIPLWRKVRSYLET